MKQPDEILLAGTGNLAAHLAGLFADIAGFRLDVAGRDPAKTHEFCNKFGGLPFREEEGKQYLAVIVCVSDQAIESVAAKYGRKGAVLIHTSGASPMETLLTFHQSVGVFWPVQTFTAGREIGWTGLPVCIQSNDSLAADFLSLVTERTGIMPVESTSADRLRYHLAAVFVCNFVNHLYALADIWCREHLLETETLKALILETARKVQSLEPPEAQTGPAKRHDIQSLDKHLELLSDHPALKQVYTLLSKQIMNRYQYLLKP